MTMFKTKEEIEEMARDFGERSAEYGYYRTESLRGFKIGYTQAQQDIKETCSGGMVEAIEKINEVEFDGEFERYKTYWSKEVELWQAAKFSSKAQIDTLKQRELGYQGDLRGKDRIINDKDSHIIEITKELQDKDAEIERLNKELREFKNINQSEAILNTSLYRKNKELTEKLNSAWRLKAAVDIETKYQETVRDIKWLLTDCDRELYTNSDKIDEIKAKYGLNKKEG